jgi:Glyoxalase-like domain
MQLELDHLFICTAPGAPEAEKLVDFGLHEGPPNQHPGQGTACRRFSFANAMIELLWVRDASESQSESTKRTLLWERWSDRQNNASPFGICVRPVHAEDKGSPFLAWDYRPVYLPNTLSMQIGEAGVEEPMWIHLSFMRRAQREQCFTEHPNGVREITRLTLATPTPLQSNASQKIIESGVLATRTGATSLLEIEFDGHRREEHEDFRPHLPVIFQV